MAIELIQSADDPRIAAYRALRAHDAEHRDGLFVAETREVVRQLVDGTRFRVRSVLLTEAAGTVAAAWLARRPEVPVYVAPVAVLKAIVGFDFHRGCLALAERAPGPSLEALLAAAPRRLVLLERVSNPDNLGGVLRAARALGVDAAVLSPECADPLHRKTVRVSMAAALTLPWTRVSDWPAACARVRAEGVALIALTPAGTTDVASLARASAGRAALLVGSEGDGLLPETIAAADVSVRIPMIEGVDSLNVVTACAIVLDRLGGAR